MTSVLAATEAVFAAVDILDSRYDDFRFTLPDVIADNAPAAAGSSSARRLGGPTSWLIFACSAAC